MKKLLSVFNFGEVFFFYNIKIFPMKLAHVCTKLYFHLSKIEVTGLMKRITIKDIAKALNMHHSTVSRSLRNDGSVNAETRKRVLAYAREHGYQINRNALHLRGDASNVIAVVVPNVNHSFFSNIISRVANLAFEQGYVVSVYQSNESLQQEKQIVKALIQNNVAGVLASVSMQTRDGSHFKALHDFRIPLILFDRVTHDLEVTRILAKNEEALVQTVNRLAQKGFSKIAHLSGIPEMNVYNDRQQGYRKGIRQQGFNYEKCLVISDGFTIENGKKAVHDLFADFVVPDALICDSHFLLLGALAELKQMNINVPNDFGLAGFGGYFETGIVHQGIISIIQPEEEMAKSAFEALLYQINSTSDAIKLDISFNVSFIES